MTTRKDPEPKRPRSEKMIAWAQHYRSNGCNATQASISAGYKGSKDTLRSYAKTIKKNAWIQWYLRKEAKKQEKTLGITSEWKKKKLKKIIVKGLGTKKDFHGNNVPVDLSAARGAIHELNLMDGDHAPAKTEVISPIKVSSDDPELMTAIAKLINKL